MDFTAHDLRIATIDDAALVDGVLHLTLDLGGTRRTTEAHIAENYTPDALVGRQVVVVTGPTPIVLAAVSPSQGAVLLRPDRPVLNGTRVV